MTNQDLIWQLALVAVPLRVSRVSTGICAIKYAVGQSFQTDT